MTVVKQPIKNNNTITWEMAAYNSTEELYSDIKALDDYSINNLRETIDSYIDSRDYLDSDGIRTQEHKNRWMLLSANALRIAKNLEITYLLTSSEILNTVIKKQKDYEDFMYMQYKRGKLDPEPGEKTQDRLNFLRKNHK